MNQYMLNWLTTKSKYKTSLNWLCIAYIFVYKSINSEINLTESIRVRHEDLSIRPWCDGAMDKRWRKKSVEEDIIIMG